MNRIGPYTVSFFLSGILLCGCSTTKEMEDFRSSYGILYPVKKIGQSTRFIGTSMEQIATPEQWATKRPAPFAASVTPEQERVLLEGSVRFDLDEPADMGFGFGARSSQFSPPIRSFLLYVEQIAGARFDWWLDPNLDNIAMAFPGGVIVVNPRVCAGLSTNAQLLMHLHEAGHHMLGHTSAGGTVTGATQPWVRPAFELAADRWAAIAMLRAGIPSASIVYAALESFGNQPPSATHPRGIDRVGNIRRAVESR